MMYHSLKLHFAAAALVVASSAFTAHAQTGRELLKEAEAAYQNIDFEKSRDKAQAALEKGGNSAKDVTRLYFLLGVANSALKNGGAARKAFLRMLALDPNVKAEQSLSPSLRGPLLEAKGQFSGEQLTATTVMNQGRGILVMKLTDPASLTSKVRFKVRTNPKDSFAESENAPKAEMGIEVEGLEAAGYVEFTLELVDEYGNVLFSEGTDLAPKSLGELRSASSRGRGPVDVRQTVDRTPYFVAAGVLGGLGIASGLVGLLAGYLPREDSAATWNDDSQCLVPGMGTRLDQCQSVQDDIGSGETLMAVGFIGAGVFLVGSAVTLAIMPGGAPEMPTSGKAEVGRRSKSRGLDLSCSGGVLPGFMGVGCTGRF